MKKTWFLAVLCALLVTNVFAGSCPSKTTEYTGTQEPEDDEFLYPTVNDWKTAYNTYNGLEGKRKSDTVNTTIYECDSDYCTYPNAWVYMKTQHYFKGKPVNGPVAYRCRTDVADRWDQYTVSECSSLPYSGHKIAFADSAQSDRDCYYTYNTDKLCCITDSTMKDCLDAKDAKEPVYWENGECKCNENKTWNSKQKKCVQKTSNVSNKCTQGSEKITSPADCKNKGTFECVEKDGANCKCGKCNSNNNGYIGKCHPSVCKSEICKACCAKPASETIWDRTAQACQCVNGGNFTKENNQWFCKVKDDSQEETTKCDEALMVKVAEWKVKCSNHATVLSEIEQLESYCAAKPTQDVFLRLYDDLKNTVEKSCIKTPTNTTVDIKTQITNVNNAYSQLSAIHNKFRDNVSVWKDAEGNFNTARLASDTVAGVVLGTTGALVTSHVVKKNQVENGFEDIKCTIGGQNVAGWGDQFRVGIQ